MLKIFQSIYGYPKQGYDQPYMYLVKRHSYGISIYKLNYKKNIRIKVMFFCVFLYYIIWKEISAFEFMSVTGTYSFRLNVKSTNHRQKS